MSLRSLLIGAAALVAGAACAQTLPVETGLPSLRVAEAALRSAPVAQLASWYLACDRASRHGPLDPLRQQHCSVAAEALLQRHFDGDFDRLIAWWRSHRDADAEAPLDPGC